MKLLNNLFKTIILVGKRADIIKKYKYKRTCVIIIIKYGVKIFKFVDFSFLFLIIHSKRGSLWGNETRRSFSGFRALRYLFFMYIRDENPDSHNHVVAKGTCKALFARVE